MVQPEAVHRHEVEQGMTQNGGASIPSQSQLQCAELQGERLWTLIQPNDSASNCAVKSTKEDV